MSLTASKRATSASKAGLAQQAYRLLEHAIIVGDLQPNQVLSEPELMEATGMGRSPIRDAIQLLADNHLATIAPYRGAFVSHLEPQTELLLLEMRRELDPVLANATAENAHKEDCRRLKQLGRKVQSAIDKNDSAAIIDIDGELKELMLEVCGNPFLATSLRPIYAVCRRFYFNAVRTPDRSLGKIYLEMIEAMAAKDPCRSEKAALNVVEKVEEIARNQLVGLK
ncbi:MAG: GntR family transcriptional regulator [Rhodovibrionaceae bacterium]